MAIDLALIEASSTTHAEDLRRALKGAFGSAGVLGVADLDVTQRGAGANMSVDVATGQCLVDDGQALPGLYPFINTAVWNLPLDAADPTNPRVDIVVARVRDAQYGDSGAPLKAVEKVTGTPAASPSVPATPARSLKLAEILVAAGATSIVNANIGEKRVMAALAASARGRLASAVCGVATGPGIGGSYVLINGSSRTVTVEAGRRVAVRFLMRGTTNVAGDVLSYRVKRGSTVISPNLDAWRVGVSGETHAYYAEATDEPPAGTHAYTVEAIRIVGTGSGTVAADSWVAVDDVGAATIT